LHADDAVAVQARNDTTQIFADFFYLSKPVKICANPSNLRYLRAKKPKIKNQKL